VECVHIWGGSSRAVKVETLIRLYRARVQFFRKHYGRLTAFLYKIILAFNSLVRIVPGAVYYLRNEAGRQKHYAFRQLLKAVVSF
jgi:hypothetical protein